MQPSHYLFLQRPLWAGVFFATCVVFFFFSGWVNGRDRNKSKGADRDRGSRTLILALSPVGAIFMFASPFLFPSARMAFAPAALFYVGIGLFWAGLVLYAWAIRTLGEFFRTSVQLLEGHRLVSAGPYRLLRHPVYAAGILAFTGMGVDIGNWGSVAAALGTTGLVYAWRIYVEEAALREKFGAEYEAYRRRTWAVIPLLW
jgi:protein-S-isoprenylcysteine O-methyltransferase Ste14